MQKIQISYRTSPELPPPHAFQAEIGLELLASDLWVRFSRTFIERDLIDAAEIEAEGFTEQDDFEWSGKLPLIWKKQLESLRTKTRLIAEEPRQLYLVVDDGGKISGRPEPDGEWILFTEQIMQACLEAGGKELPMELVLGKLEKNQFFEKVVLVWSFEHMSLQGQSVDGQQKMFPIATWQQTQGALKQWIEAEAQTTDLYQIPAHRGWFWLLNGEIWLPFKKDDLPGEVWEWVLWQAGI